MSSFQTVGGGHLVVNGADASQRAARARARILANALATDEEPLVSPNVFDDESDEEPLVNQGFEYDGDEEPLLSPQHME